MTKKEPDLGVAHSIRFRTFGNGYPRAVASAYDGTSAEP